MSAVQYDKQLRSYLFLALCCSAILINIFGDYFTQFLLAEIIILSLFAMSLDFLAGRGGMLSLGHAMFLGIGAYTTTILYIYLSIDPFLCILITIIIGLILGYLIALIITKTHGIFFIMITLALGEMFHSWAFTNDSLGGSDGISGIARPDLLFMGLDLNEPLLFTYYLIVWLILSYLFLSAITDSPLGRNLDAIRQNSNRVLSLGGSVKFYKSASFGISSAIACLAGSLYAQLNGFVSPELSHWTVSGEGLIMIIVGGIGSLSGAILGAAVVHVLQHELSKLVDWWMLLMGGGFILIVLFMKDGLWGIILKFKNYIMEKIC